MGIILFHEFPEKNFHEIPFTQKLSFSGNDQVCI